MSDEEYSEFYRNGGFKYDQCFCFSWVQEIFIKPFGLSPCRMLDAGCGDGFWSNIFQEHRFEVTGIDRIPGGIEIAREKYPKCQFVLGDIEKPFDLDVDLVFARTLTHFWSRDFLDTGKTVAMLKNLLSHGPCLLEAYQPPQTFFMACKEAGAIKMICHTNEYYQVMIV